MGRYCSYLLPKQAGGTAQILVDKTSPMTGRLRVYLELIPECRRLRTKVTKNISIQDTEKMNQARARLRASRQRRQTERTRRMSRKASQKQRRNHLEQVEIPPKGDTETEERQPDSQSPVTLRRDAVAGDQGLGSGDQQSTTGMEKVLDKISSALTGMEKMLDKISSTICAPFERLQTSIINVLDKDTTGGWEATKKLHNFLSESKEYADPHEYGWRIKRRRVFLTVGTVLYTCLAVYQGNTRSVHFNQYLVQFSTM